MTKSHGNWDDSIHDLNKFKLTPEEKKRRELNQQRYQVQSSTLHASPSPATSAKPANSPLESGDWKKMLETLHALNSEQVQRRLQTHSTSLDSPQEGPSLSGAAEGVDRLRVTPTVMQSGIALAAQPTVPLSQELSRTRQQQQTQSSSSSSSGMQRKFVNLSSSQSGGGSVGESVDPVKLRRWWTLVSSLLSVLDRPDLQSNSGEYEKDVACLSSDIDSRKPLDTLLRGQNVLFGRWKDYLDALDKEHLLQACDQLMERNQHLERVIQEQKQMIAAIREQQSDSLLLQEQTMDRLQEFANQLEKQQMKMDSLNRDMEQERVMRGVRWSIYGNTSSHFDGLGREE